MNEQKSKSTINEELPELELRSVLKSSEKITENKEDIQEMVSWRDYTFINTASSQEFFLLDEKAKKKSFSKIPKKKDFTVQDIFSQKGILRPNMNSNYYSYNGEGQNLTPESIRLVLKIYPNWKADSVRPDEKKTIGYNLDKDNFFELANGKYILLYNKDGFNEVFQVIDDRNIVLPPEEWKLVSDANPERTPEEVKKYISFLKTFSSSGIKELNEQYLLLQNNASINILDRSNIEGPALFSENLPSVGSNIAVDPTNKETIYFCQEEAPDRVGKLNMSGDRATWKVQYAKFPKQYESVRNLQLDPTGTFFLFYSGSELVMVTKDTLEEVKKEEGLSHVSFDSLGRIRAIDKEGYFNVFEVDYSSLAESMAKRKAQNLSKNINIEDIFSDKKKKEKTYDQKTVENLQVQKTAWEAQVLPKITSAQNMNDVLTLRGNLNTLKLKLRAENLEFEQVDFITEGIEKAILTKEKEYAGQEAQKYIQGIEAKLAEPISLHIINELRTDLDNLKPIEGSLELPDREKIRKLADDVNKRAIELFSTEGSKALEDVSKLLEGTKQELEKMENKNQFDDWMEFRMPQFKERLGMYYRDCPTEAFEASAAIAQARKDLIALAETYGKKFETEYAKIREKSAEKSDALVQTLSSDVNGLMDRVKTKQFKTRDDAELYLNSSEAKRVLEAEIQELKKNNPDAGAELERSLKVAVANTLGGIERGIGNVIAETGEQMIKFGEIQFPRFEGKVKELHEAEARATFRLDERSKGPGVNPKKIYGDVEIIITNSKGEKHISRLYEGLGNEDEWRLGLMSYRGDEIPPSYMTAEDFKKFKKSLGEWEKGKLKQEDEKYRNELAELFGKREKAKSDDRNATKDAKWQVEYRKKIEEYGKFCAENNIILLRRVDAVRETGNIDGNGKGYVPKWQNHWVVDPTTEKYLEQMAEHFKMQGDLKEGVLNLYGHAGTGKDVLIKMFANKTNRPYFAVDCTKWTTEFELSEDVALEAKDGATQTIKVPSSVLNGIQTPGGLVYFNEINAMPEQAQIFLHALFDEKRAMTLKTSSGKVISALPSVLMACSMNPNYPGTFDPQFATKSRMVSIEVDYPPLRREVKEGEPAGKEAPYNSSEALRVAREVKSLVDFTYELNMDRNEFVKIWDKQVNGINNDALPISKSQEFDLNVVRALVQFADTLRRDFKINFDKTKEKLNALPVFQPLTLREMRRCAYSLSKMPDEEKLSKDSDETARALLKKIFLSNIFKTDDRNKIENALKVMNSKNRVL